MAYKTKNAKILPIELNEAYICDALNITFTQLQEQPEEWVQKRMVLLSAKNRAEKDLTK